MNLEVKRKHLPLSNFFQLCIVRWVKLDDSLF